MGYMDDSPKADFSKAPDDRASKDRPPTRQQAQFSIKSLMMSVTLAAVLLAILRWLPGVGIVLLMAATPAFIRATVSASKEKASGNRLSVGRKLVIFLGSFGLVVSVAMSAGAAFYTVCWGGFVVGATVSEMAGAKGWDTLSWGLGFGVILGIIGQLVFTVWFIVWLWRRRSQNRNRLGDIGFIFCWLGWSSLVSCLIAQSVWPNFHADSIAALSMVVWPGLVCSAVAIARPQRLLASCGIGFGLTAVAMFVFVARVGGDSLDRAAIMVLTILGALAAVVLSAIPYLLATRASRNAPK